MKKFLCLLAALLLFCPAGLAEESKECEILLPDGYTGTLPVYRATLRDESNVPLFAELDVSLFNQSGDPKFEPALLRKKPLRSGAYTYPDGAVLATAPEALYYEEYDGTYYNVLLSAEDGSEIHSETPRSSLKSAIAGLAGGAQQCWPDLDEQPQLTTDALPGITLDEAKARMEALLEKLGVGDNARFVYGLDMQPERIRELGAHYNEVFSFQTPEWDFALATEEDQGFYVYYEFQLNGLDLQSMDSAPFSASAYFTREGMHSFRLTNPAVIGEIYDTPDALVSRNGAGTFRAGQPRPDPVWFQRSHAGSNEAGLHLAARPAEERRHGAGPGMVRPLYFCGRRSERRLGLVFRTGRRETDGLLSMVVDLALKVCLW